MSFKKDVRKNVKDYLTELIPEDSASRIVTVKDLDELLFNSDISKPLTEFENKNPDEQSCEDFISAMKIGLNLGVRYGMLSFADRVAIRANAILDSENTEDLD